MGILEDYAMYNAGGYPVIFPEKHNKVVMEIFEVTPATLRNLDRYEGIRPDSPAHESDLYKRVSVSIDQNTSIPYIAEAYVGTEAFKKRKLAKIPSGDWLQHQKEQKDVLAAFEVIEQMGYDIGIVQENKKNK